MQLSNVINKVLGSGKCYFNADGGERYLGDTPGFDITIATTEVTDDSSDTPVAQTDLEVTTKIMRTGTVTLKNISAENLALFLMGTAADLAQTTGAVVAEVHDAVKLDRYYQLGASNSNPSGVRGISLVTVKNDVSPPTTYAAGTDYTVDLVTGRLYIVPGGAILAGTNLRVDYTKATNTREQIVANSTEPVEGEFRFVANNITGANRDVYGPRVRMKPNGKFVWKDRQTVQSATFDLSFLDTVDGSGKAALYVDGAAA